MSGLQILASPTLHRSQNLAPASGMVLALALGAGYEMEEKLLTKLSAQRFARSKHSVDPGSDFSLISSRLLR